MKIEFEIDEDERVREYLYGVSGTIPIGAFVGGLAHDGITPRDIFVRGLRRYAVDGEYVGPADLNEIGSSWDACMAWRSILHHLQTHGVTESQIIWAGLGAFARKLGMSTPDIVEETYRESEPDDPVDGPLGLVDADGSEGPLELYR